MPTPDLAGDGSRGDEGPHATTASRRVRLRQRRGIARQLQRVGDAFEQAIARHSPLGDPPVYDPREFPWVSRIEGEWRAIRAELDRVLRRRDELASFHEIARQVESITHDATWKTYFLAGYGMRSARAREECPETARILGEIPGMMTAMFSILAPGKHIPPHRGPYSGVLRLHLGLIVPRPRERCWIRVADERRHWDEGKALIFDGTFIHEVRNETDAWRVLLFVDFVRPLRAPMRQLNRALLKVVGWTPMLREAARNQRRWEQQYFAPR